MQIPFPLYVSHSPRQSIPQLTLGKIKEAAEDFVRSIFLSILVFHLLITDSPKRLKKFERILWNSFIDPCIHFIGVKIYSV